MKRVIDDVVGVDGDGDANAGAGDDEPKLERVIDVDGVLGVAGDAGVGGERGGGSGANVTRGAIDFRPRARIGLAGVLCKPIVRRRVTLEDFFNSNALSNATRRTTFTKPLSSNPVGFNFRAFARDTVLEKNFSKRTFKRILL